MGMRKVGGWTEQHGAVEVFFPPVEIGGTDDRSLLQHQPTGGPGRGRGPDERARAMTPASVRGGRLEEFGQDHAHGRPDRRAHPARLRRLGHQACAREVRDRSRGPRFLQDARGRRLPGRAVVAPALCPDARAWRCAGDVVRGHPRLCRQMRPRPGRGLQARGVSRRSRSAATAPLRASRCRAASRRSWRLPRIVPRPKTAPLPVFHLDDIKGIADFVVATCWAQADMTAKLIDDCFVLDKDRLPHARGARHSRSRGCGRSWASSRCRWPRPLGAFWRRPSSRREPSRPMTMRRSTAMPSPMPPTTRNRAQGSRWSAKPPRVIPSRVRRRASSAVRIFTGAVMPDGFDTVAMQEDVRIEQKRR